MEKLPITITIITLNEEKNLPRLLSSITWASEVILVDSGSTDDTLKIAESFGAKIFIRHFRGYGEQKNFAHLQARYDWVFNLDADEEVSAELQKRIFELHKNQAFVKKPVVFGYKFYRKNNFFDQWIQHSGWYPNRQTRLAHKESSEWTEPRVHEKLKVRGEVQCLSEAILHYPYPDPILDFIRTQNSYAKLKSLDLRDQGVNFSWWKIFIKPTVKFIEIYFWKRGFLDGFLGFLIAIQMAVTSFWTYSYLFRKTEKK